MIKSAFMAGQIRACLGALCFGVAVLAPAVCLPGCKAKGAWTEADALRERIVTLEKELATAKAERDEVRALLAEADRVRLSGGSDLPADVAAALPRCASVKIDRFSGLDSTGSALDVYVMPLDGMQRFVQVVGTITIRADLVPQDPAASPRMVGSATFGPAELRAAYRSTMMGTYYSFQVPLNAGKLDPTASLAITVELLDALSGRTHRATSVVRLSSLGSR